VIFNMQEWINGWGCLWKPYLEKGTLYFEVFALLLHLRSFQIISGSIQGNIRKCTYVRRKNGAYGGNSEIVSIDEIYKVSVGVYFVSECLSYKINKGTKVF
jgi:hypothetical protein